MSRDLYPFSSDPELIDVLLAPRTRLILVLGGSDSGKTTLVEKLLGLLSASGETAVVDADTGQSHVGPPTIIGWGACRGGFSGWERIPLLGYYFTGSLSPVRNLLPCAAGFKLVTDAALAACTKVVADTSGLISDPYGRVLKQYEIDLTGPQVVLALERSGDLEPVLSGLPRAGLPAAGPRIFRLPVPGAVGTKRTAVRAAYRRELFERFFSGARQVRIPLRGMGVRFIRDPAPLNRENLAGRIVSFRNELNRDYALGMVIDVSREQLTVRLRAAGEDRARQPAVVVVGTVSVDQ